MGAKGRTRFCSGRVDLSWISGSVNRKIVIRVAAYIVVGVLTAGIWIQSGELDLGWIRYLSAAVFTATVFISVWDLWLWRIPLVQRIPNVPRNIRGTWKGELQSLWFDP